MVLAYEVWTLKLWIIKTLRDEKIVKGETSQLNFRMYEYYLALAYYVYVSNARQSNWVTNYSE
ncbi:hypothetical protein CR513_56618, partial [Mucuna pruriens]